MMRHQAWLLLMSCLPCSGCFTWRLWEEGIGMHRLDFDGATTTDVRVLAQDPGGAPGLALRVDASTLQRLVPLPEDRLRPGHEHAWLVALPLENHEALGALLVLLDGLATSDASLAVHLADGPRDDSWRGTLHLHVDTEWPGAVPIPEGLQVTANRVQLEVACELQMLDAEPAGGTRWRHGPCRYGNEVHTGTPVALKVLLTPGSVALDVLTLPVQAVLALWLTIVFWNG